MKAAIHLLLLCAALTALKCLGQPAVAPGSSSNPATPLADGGKRESDSSPATSAQVREVLAGYSGIQTSMGAMQKSVGDLQKGAGELQNRIPSWQIAAMILVVLAVVVAGLGWLFARRYYRLLRDHVDECLRDELASVRKGFDERLEQELAPLRRTPEQADRESKRIEKPLGEIRDEIIKLKGRLGSELNPLLTENRFQGEIKRWEETISKQPKASSAFGAEAQNAVAQLEHFGSRADKISTVLTSIEQRLRGYDVVIAGIEGARQQMVQAASVLQTSAGSTTKVLASLGTEVGRAVSEVSGKVANIGSLLARQTAICEEAQATAKQQEEHAKNALAEASAERRKAEALNKDAEAKQADLEQERGRAEAARKASVDACAKELAARQANQNWVDETNRANAQAKTEREAAKAVKAAAETEHKEAAADRRAAELARVEAVAKLEQASQERQSAAKERTALESKMAELAVRQANANQAIAKQAADEEKNRKILADAEMAKTEAEARLHVATEEREAEEAAREEATASLKQAKELVGSLWPEGFRDGGVLVDVRREIEGRLGKQNPEAGVLLAVLSRYRWALASAATPELAEVLSEVSRCAYRYWKAGGLTAPQSDEEAKKWAGVFSAHVAPHFSVRVASPGSLKEPTWMNFKQGGAPHVAEAETWSVLNAKNIAVKRADVI